MSHGLLEILRYFFLALVWLFFIYAARMVVVEVRRGRDQAPAESLPGRDRPRAERHGGLKLRVVQPRRWRGRTFELDGEVTLGRSPGCVVALEEDTFVSAVHARVYAADGECYIEDLGSTNGTFHNGEPVHGPTPLRRGDRVTVGRTVLEVTR
ncbi:MAG TPA: FHA domain-containing protein [Acidimicrobiales bacterium]|jgi:hypothetical protein|nr:FHA domain-containing protein [Acidimicrobiales bacterium]